MKSIQNWLDHYAQSHQNSTNKTIHWICVPIIMFSLMGLLTSIPNALISSPFPEAMQPYVNWATVFALVVVVFYLRLSITMGLGFIPVGLALIVGNVAIQQAGFMPLWQFSIILFVVAWIGQFIGHKIEGEKPSFFEDMQFLLIGPAWLMSFVFKKLGIAY